MPHLDIRDFQKTVSEIYGFKHVSKSKDDVVVGLEFENETEQDFDLPLIPGWKFHPENSLRNFGFEYVLGPPVTIDKALQRTQDLFETLNRYKSGPMSNSLRTSTHVHFDMGHYTFADVSTFACVYWLLEDYLSGYCGEHRKGNLFCLRLKESAYLQNALATCIQAKYPFISQLCDQGYRYGSLNFASIPKFGSLEFRLMRGVDNSVEAAVWINALESIRQFALKFKNPLELKTSFIKDYHASEFPEAVLGEQQANTFRSFLPNSFSITNSIRSSFLDLNPLFLAHPTWDWTEEIKSFVPPKPLKKEIPGYFTNWNPDPINLAMPQTNVTDQDSLNDQFDALIADLSFSGVLLQNWNDQ